MRADRQSGLDVRGERIILMAPIREIVLDTETTGLSPEDGDRIIEIGCVELIDGVASGKEFHTYLNPERPISAGSYAVTGLDEAFLADKPHFDAIIDSFLEFIGDAPLIIHNAPFDMGFLDHELKRHKRKGLNNNVIIDTLVMARRKFPGAPVNLDALCRRFSIDNTHRTKHGALLDAYLLTEVYLDLTGGRAPSLKFDEIDGASSDTADAISRSSVGVGSVSPRAPIPPRPHALPSRLDSQAVLAHRRFVGTFGARALWLKK